MKGETLEKRFWRHIVTGKKYECWKWNGAKNRGYGTIKVNNKPTYAHRVSWEIHYWKIPSNMYVLHHCDNHECCNPEHLFIGTLKDNSQDMLAKGRGNKPFGERVGTSKLNCESVKQIRSEYSRGNGYRLANKFGVSPVTIWRIIHRELWRNTGESVL